METGVRGEVGLRAHRHVLEVQGHELESVIIRHL